MRLRDLITGEARARLSPELREAIDACEPLTQDMLDEFALHEWRELTLAMKGANSPVLKHVLSDRLKLRAFPLLVEALEKFLESYLQGANSGDWGCWDPEEEDEVIAVRAALALAREASE